MTFDEAVFQLRARQRMVPTSLGLPSVSELEVLSMNSAYAFMQTIGAFYSKQAMQHAARLNLE
jgi:hypothetical protein